VQEAVAQGTVDYWALQGPHHVCHQCVPIKLTAVSKELLEKLVLVNQIILKLHPSCTTGNQSLSEGYLQLLTVMLECYPCRPCGELDANL